MAIPAVSTRLARDLWKAWRQSMPMHQVSYETHGLPEVNYETGQITALVSATLVWTLLEAYATEEIDGVRVVETDQRAFVWAGDVALAATLRDLVIIDDLTWNVIAVAPFMGGAIWKLQLRREEDPSV